MNIAIDIRELSIGNTGISQYTINLICCLKKNYSTDFFYLFTNKKYADSSLPGNFKIIVDGLNKNNTIYETFILPVLLKKYKINLFISPYYKLPFFTRVPKIITVHDIGFITFPIEYYARTRFYRMFAAPYLRICLAVSKKIIAVSEYTKFEILKKYGIASDKIIVIYNSINNSFSKNLKIEKIEKILALKKKTGNFIFSVSNYKPHKNIRNLITAFACIRKKIDLNLVLAGPSNIWRKEVEEHITECELNDRVFLVTPADNTELAEYYSAAEIYCHPSIHEGFGFPVVEAQSCGCPVISSPRTSLAEILGDSAVFFKPESPKDIPENFI